MPSSDFLINLIDLILEYYAQKYEQQNYSEKIITHFLQGQCGILALTLQAIYPQGAIYINETKDHLVFKIDNFYYDARGKILKPLNYEMATESDFLRLVPYYGTSNFTHIKQIIADLSQIGLFYQTNQDWAKTQEYMQKRTIRTPNY